MRDYQIQSSYRNIDKLKQIYLYACSKDVEVIKPGNVNIDYSHIDTSAYDFLRSAHDSCRSLFKKNFTLGERIYHSVIDSRKNTDVNTNLGIIILTAPIVHSLIHSTKNTFRSSLKDVIKKSRLSDTELLCKAINFVNPGGLGEKDDMNTHSLPRVTLGEIMDKSAYYDRLSYQYSTGYSDILDFVVPRIVEHKKNIENTDFLLSLVFLEILCEIPDTHISRKFNEKIAKKTSNEACDLIKIINTERSRKKAISRICQLDYEYKNKGINPGTTADLLLSGVMIERLLCSDL